MGFQQAEIFVVQLESDFLNSESLVDEVVSY